MVEAFEDMTSAPGLWSSYDRESHPALDACLRNSNAESPKATGTDQATLIETLVVEREDTKTTGIAEGYLVVSNISKKQNIQSLIKVAIAFGIENIIIVGQPHFDINTCAPVNIPDVAERLTFHRMSDLVECRAFLGSINARCYCIVF